MSYDQYGNYYDETTPNGYVTDPTGAPVGTQAPSSPSATQIAASTIPPVATAAAASQIPGLALPSGFSAAAGAALPYAGPAAAILATAPSLETGWRAGSGKGFTGGVKAGFNEAPWYAKGAGIIGGGYGGVFGSSNPEQDRRFALKDQVKGNVLGGSLTFDDPSGKVFDLGKGDYNVDFKNPLAAQAVGYANPFAEYLASKYGQQEYQAKSRSDLAGQMANTFMDGATDSAGTKNAALSFLSKWGVAPSEVRNYLNEQFKAKRINEGTFNAYMAAITNLTDPGPKETQDLSVKLSPTAQRAGYSADQRKRGVSPPASTVPRRRLDNKGNKI